MHINRWMAGALVVLLTIFSLIWLGGGRTDANPEAAAQLPVIVKGMSLEEKVGQMFMPDFRQWDGEDVTEINEEIVQAIQQHHLGGVILFRENAWLWRLLRHHEAPVCMRHPARIPAGGQLRKSAPRSPDYQG